MPPLLLALAWKEYSPSVVWPSSSVPSQVTWRQPAANDVPTAKVRTVRPSDAATTEAVTLAGASRHTDNVLTSPPPASPGEKRVGDDETVTPGEPAAALGEARRPTGSARAVRMRTSRNAADVDMCGPRRLGAGTARRSLRKVKG